MTDAGAKPPRVSVVMPLHDGGTYVAEALASVAGQTLPPDEVEIIVVDDGSADDGAAVVARACPRASVLRQANRGPSAARNVGIRQARAPYLLFLDADDRLAPDALATALALFEQRRELGLVYAGWRFIDEAGAVLPQRSGPPYGEPFASLLMGNALVIHAAVVRRELVQRVGGFDEGLHSAEDWDLWLRIARLGEPWGGIDRPLGDYRMRLGALHTHGVRLFADRVRVLDKVFADPALSPAFLAMRTAAYQNVHFLSACDLYRVHDRETGRRAFRAGALLAPDALADPDTLRRLCRWLLPQGLQCEAAIARDWRRLSGTLRAMLRDLFGAPDLEREIADRRWLVELAYWQTATRLFRKATTAAVLRRLSYSM